MQETSGRLGKFMPQISCDERGINNKSYKKRTRKQNMKEQCPCDTYNTHHVQQLLDKLQIELFGRASDTVPSDNITSASNNNKNYSFVSNPKIKRMLVVWCSGLATATSNQIQSAKNILDGFSQ
jgi:hypothetical protein